MAKIANRAEMYQDGWVDATIGGIDCIKLVVDNDYTMIAQWSRDGFTSRKAAAAIQAELGPAYKIHTLYDSQRRQRIATLEYI